MTTHAFGIEVGLAAQEHDLVPPQGRTQRTERLGQLQIAALRPNERISTPQQRCVGPYLQTSLRPIGVSPYSAGSSPEWFGGSSADAHALAASQSEVYLTWGEPPAEVGRKFADVRARAAREGRTVRFGVRLHVIVRPTEDEAWRDAEALISRLDDDTVARAQGAFAKMDSEGQRRMAALHAAGRGRRREDLEVHPHLWAGVGLVRGGAGTAAVGDPRQVAALLDEYRAVGAEAFILSGYPHLEEAYRVAELLFPLLELDHEDDAPVAVPASSAVLSGPFGEVVGGHYSPKVEPKLEPKVERNLEPKVAHG